MKVLRERFRESAAGIAACLDLRGLDVFIGTRRAGEVADVAGDDLTLDGGESVSLDDVLTWGCLAAPSERGETPNMVATARALRFALDVEELVEKRARWSGASWLQARTKLIERREAAPWRRSSRGARFDPPFVADPEPLPPPPRASREPVERFLSPEGEFMPLPGRRPRWAGGDC